MAKPQFHVQHFVVCPRVSVGHAEPGNPYTLHDVKYAFDYPADREFPVVEPELWVFVRLVNGTGHHQFGLDVRWLDSPGGSESTANYALPPVRFRDRREVVSRAWKLSFVRFPGPGRYQFSLTGRGTLPLARDFILVRSIP
ncbi:unnamed protein product [Gemmataceae bacterium]|nr:unnamed protein product [Gemmataceae bacterium]VTT96400.1 unnamed protein product [Gemmataceae bacterium]